MNYTRNVCDITHWKILIMQMFSLLIIKTSEFHILSLVLLK